MVETEGFETGRQFGQTKRRLEKGSSDTNNSPMRAGTDPRLPPAGPKRANPVNELGTGPRPGLANPNSIPRPILTRHLRRQLEADAERQAREVVRSLIEKAKSGDVAAQALIWERVEGKVPQPAANGDGNVQIDVRIVALGGEVEIKR